MGCSDVFRLLSFCVRLLIQQAEGERESTYASRFPPPSPFISSEPPAYWMVSLTVRVGLPPLNYLREHPYSHTEKCTLLISYMFLNPIKLTVKIPFLNMGSFSIYWDFNTFSVPFYGLPIKVLHIFLWSLFLSILLSLLKF